MVVEIKVAALRSKSGGCGEVFEVEVAWRFAFDDFGLEFEEGLGVLVFESNEISLSLSPASPSRSLSTAPTLGLLGSPSSSKPRLGSTSRFCLLGGRISSKSTGTPRLTRNILRMRDFVQLGGWVGGGETSCCQRERERSERKGEGLVRSVGSSGGGVGGVLCLVGKMALR